MRTKAVLFLLACFCPSLVFAWGPGHDDVNKLAVEMLAGAIPAESGANVVKWAHTPDDFTPWEELKQFRVSVEERDRPKLVGKPVTVGGFPEKRGVVSAANYVVRRYGVHSNVSSAMAQPSRLSRKKRKGEPR
jgi:hypothetical protein